MAEFVDITSLLLRKAAALKTDAVVKSPHFSLFQGTHALEIDNDKLDSGLITLTDAEENFDCTAPLELTKVLWVSDSLLRSIFTWLNNSSLSVTVFSCRYVEELLVNYTKDPGAGLAGCKFGNTEIKSDVNYLLVHKVLRSVVLGVLHFVRLCLTLGQAGVVYEEEDINTHNMHLDVLSLVPSDEILKEIQGSIIYLQKQFADEKDSMVLQAILQILAKLIDIPYYLSTKVSKAGNFLNTSIIDSMKTYTDVLRENLEYLNKLEPIEGCFTMGIQKRLDNRSPTRQLISPLSEDYTSFSLFLDDIEQILAISQRKTSHDIINHALNFANTKHHVLSRALYPLFLIRDDRTVLGEESFHDLLIEELLRFSCCDSEWFTTENQVVKVKLTDILQEISVGYFEWLNAMNQNPCRQRQHLSRAIVMFDTLQAKSEELEMHIKDVFQVYDEFEYGSEVVPALPLTSWIFYMKLEIMLQVVMRGFELELYNVWEHHPMYWYAVNLHDHILMLLDRVIKFNQYKVEKIKNMSKQLKKKKGDQKVRYKEKMQQKQMNELVMLEKSVDTLQKLVTKYEITRGVCHLEMIHLDNLLKLGHLKVPNYPFMKNPDILFKLRMKPFSTVGVPQCPTYKDYQRDLNHFMRPQFKHTPQELQEVKGKLLTNIKTIIECIQKDDDATGYRICKEDWLNWYRDIQRSSIGLSLIIFKESADGRPRVERDGFHRYFPIIKTV